MDLLLCLRVIWYCSRGLPQVVHLIIQSSNFFLGGLVAYKLNGRSLCTWVLLRQMLLVAQQMVQLCSFCPVFSTGANICCRMYEQWGPLGSHLGYSLRKRSASTHCSTSLTDMPSVFANLFAVAVFFALLPNFKSSSA